MTSLAEQLMAGPRGRALCLLAACFADERVSQVDRVIATRLDTTVETGWFSSGAIVLEQGSERQVEALVVALAGVCAIDGLWVRLALECIVDEAMYWQEPRGLLSSRQELQPALARIAGIIAQSPAAEWWTAALSPAEYQVRFLPVDHVAAIDAPAETILADAFRRRDVGEPSGYLSAWWSVPPFGLIRTCPAPAGEPSGLFLVEDGWGQTEATVHCARMRSPRVLEIDSVDVWARLCRAHAFGATETKSRDWYRTTGLSSTRWAMPDWRSVAREFDAVHLQVGAYLAASGTAIEVGPGVHSVIAGWAPGETFWLTDVVEVEPQGRVFVKDEGDDLWHPAEE
ncbi:hypothetical protein AXK57_17710 [Tsukamurella pulmonis]|uniref:hypothetical protein n=1 Tax=Tsukamurella pulmonis TaxID=47312 RepID=UPI00079A2B6B|nr:hypothetical protein [Tsukamurella pulmonis]KXP08294.1 hypothetical protein AXK57_17710 [Tsukamurella pulmonis]RDH10196.1 hypothetical protein DVB88_18885 [Tsukamurella pulmonis]